MQAIFDAEILILSLRGSGLESAGPFLTLKQADE
jgi:hypothetical protein